MVSKLEIVVRKVNMVKQVMKAQRYTLASKMGENVEDEIHLKQ